MVWELLRYAEFGRSILIGVGDLLVLSGCLASVGTLKLELAPSMALVVLTTDSSAAGPPVAELLKLQVFDGCMPICRLSGVIRGVIIWLLT